LAQAFNRPVIAEGVETLEHGAALSHFGCRYAQGYGVARPMPVEQTLSWMAQWKASAKWRQMHASIEDEDLSFKVAARSSSLWVDAIAAQLVREDDAVQLNAESEGCSFCRWFRSAGFTRYGHYPAYHDVATAHDQSHTLAIQAQGAHRAGLRDECQELLVALKESNEQQVQALFNLQQSAKETR
jgi:hypothetical protein